MFSSLSDILLIYILYFSLKKGTFLKAYLNSGETKIPNILMFVNAGK